MAVAVQGITAASVERSDANQGERPPIVQCVENLVLPGIIHKSTLLGAYSRQHRASLSAVME